MHYNSIRYICLSTATGVFWISEKDYYDRFYIGTKDQKYRLSCQGFTGPVWSTDSDPNDTVTVDQYVSGIARQDEYRAAIVDKVISELSWADTDGASDIAVYLSSKLSPVKRVALFLRPKAVQQTTTPKGCGFVLSGRVKQSRHEVPMVFFCDPVQSTGV